MTCGWCHREPDQHSLSTSGPTRCKYATHRADCPATFATKCSDHVIDGEVAPAETFSETKDETKNMDKDETIRQLEEQLAQLRVHVTPSPPTKTESDASDMRHTQSTSTSQAPSSTPQSSQSSAPGNLQQAQILTLILRS